MTEIPSRELRNDVSAVLRRVAGGEVVRVTVRGKPVADLVPAGHRPQTMPWNAFWEAVGRDGADSALADDLAEVLPDTTDDVGDDPT